MSDDPIELLERELVGAARRRAGAPGAGAAHEVAAASGGTLADQLSARRGLRRRLGGAIAVAASGLVVLLVAGGALLALHGGPHRRSPSGRSAAVSAWAKRLAVMARPQNHADQVALYRDGNDLPDGVVAPGSVRWARRTPWGEVVLLGVIVRGTDAGQLALSTADGSGTFTLTITTARLASGRLTALVVMPARTSRFTRIVMPVPDGTARVRLTVGGRSQTAAVIGNVVAAQLPARCCAAGGSVPAIPVVTYASDGSVLRRFTATAGYLSVGHESTDFSASAGN